MQWSMSNSPTHTIHVAHTTEMIYPCCLCLDPYEDQFEKKNQAKKERVAKNEYQRLRNIAKNKKIPGEKVTLSFILSNSCSTIVITHSFIVSFQF